MTRFIPVCVLWALLHGLLPAAVEAPGALVAEALSGDAIHLTWVDNASGETGYTIERSVDRLHWHVAGSVGAEVETWTDTGLDAGRLYLYRVRPTDDDSAWSNWNYAVTWDGVAADSTPDPCNVRQEPDGSVVVTWLDCFHDEDGYSIERKVGAGDYEEIHLAAADTTSWTDSSTASPGAYFYRVRVLKAGVDNTDVYTSTMQGVTWLALGDAAVAIPTGLAAHAVQTTRIELSWDAVVDAESYAVEVSRDDGRSFTSLATGLTDTGYAHTGVEYGMAYRYRVCCTTAAGTSRPSPAVSCTPVIRQDLTPPTALEATELADDGIDLTWSDNADNETAYAVERKQSSSFERIATLAANATTYNDPDGKTWYYYRVQALSGSGDSAYSNVIKADSNIETTPPTGLSVTLSGTSGAELSWTVGSGYQAQAVQRAVGAEGDFKVIAYRTSNDTSFTDWGLERGTTYRYRITHWRHPGTESQEVSLVVPTNTAVPTRPGNLTATGVASDQINLRWTDASDNETGFTVERDAGGGFSGLATLPPNTTSYCDTGLTAQQSYAYRVRATGAAGNSNWRTANATTPADDPTVAITSTAWTGYTELTITGTAANDTITVDDDGSDLVVTANGHSSTHPRTCAVIVVNAGDGEDTVTVTAAVSARSILRGGRDDDVLTALGSGRHQLVALGGGRDELTGNGHDSSYWCDPEGIDTVNASARERLWRRVHRIEGFLQFWSTDPSNAEFITAEPDGRNWNDAQDQMKYGLSERERYDLPLWGDGPSMFDVNQGLIQNCPLTGYYQCAVAQWPTRMEETAVDLGDGTYAVQVGPADHQVYARVDGDVNPGWLATLGPENQQWFLILEKVYTAYKLPNYTPPSTNVGIVGGGGIYFEGEEDAVYERIRTALDARGIVLCWTSGTPTHAPTVRQGHNHGIVEAYRDANGEPHLIVRNPYGVNRTNWDSFPLYRSQGLFTLSLAALRANMISGSIGTWALPPYRTILFGVQAAGNSFAVDAVLEPGAVRVEPDDDERHRFPDLDPTEDHTIDVEGETPNVNG